MFLTEPNNESPLNTAAAELWDDQEGEKQLLHVNMIQCQTQNESVISWRGRVASLMRLSAAVKCGDVPITDVRSIDHIILLI